MSAIDAAVTLAKASGWRLSNLEMQKMLYVAQMIHLGRYGEPIFDEDFEAWKLGPVLPSLYERAKIWGKRPIPTLFHLGELPPESTGRAVIEEAYRKLPDDSPWKLVAITHWEHGAWARNFKPNELHSVIPKADILSEYIKRSAADLRRVKYRPERGNRAAPGR